MKYSLLFSAFLLSTMMVGCSDNPIDDSFSIVPENQVDTRTITVGVGDQYYENADGSRVSVDTSDDSMWYYSWSSDDQVLGWDETNYSSPFTMSSLYNNYAVFTGTADASAVTMRLIYPYKEDLIVDDFLSIDLSTQSIDLSDPANSFAKENLYMISDMFNVTESSTTTRSMGHIFSIIQMEITPTGIVDDLYLKSATIKGLNKNAVRVSYNNAALTTNSDESEITLNFTNASKMVNNVKYTIPFSIIPHIAASGNEYSVSLSFTDGRSYGERTINGEETLRGIKTFSKNITFTAGERTPLTVNFNASEDLYEPIKKPLSEFYADMSISDDLWYVTDYSASDAAAFAGLKEAILANNDLDMIPNVVFENIASIPAEAFKDFEGEFTVGLDIATSIGDNAFDSCINLSALDTPNVESVGGGAFNNCSSLTTLSLPSLTDTDVKGDYTYAGLTLIESLSLPSYKALSYTGTFANNVNITSMTLPNLLTIKGDMTFAGCTKLTDVSLTSIESLDASSVFDACSLTSLSVGTLGDGLAYISAEAFNGATTSGTALSICANDTPNFSVSGNVLTIDEETTVTFASIAEVGARYYYLEDYSATMALPASQTWYVNDTSFTVANCEGLRDAIAMAQNYGVNGNEGPIINLVNISSIANYTFCIDTGYDPDFAGYKYSVKMPSFTGTLTQSTFKGSSLTAFEGQYVTTVNYGVFSSTLVTELYLPNAATFLNTALSTSTLTDITLGTDCAGVNNLTKQPFGTSANASAAVGTTGVKLTIKIDPDNISSITYSGNTLSWVDGSGTGDSYTAEFGELIIFDAQGSTLSSFDAETYPSGSDWYVSSIQATASEFAGLKEAILAANENSVSPKITFEYLNAIPAEAFLDFEGTFSIEATKATSIGEAAFSGCSGLSAITVESVETVGAAAFKNCSGLSTLSLPALTDTDVNGAETYYGLGVESLTFDNYTAITGDATFASCADLSILTITNVTKIDGDEIFKGCTSLSAISLPYITTITGSDIFASCSLTNLTLGGYWANPASDAVVTFIDPLAFNNATITGTTLSIYMDEPDNCNFTIADNTMTVDGYPYTFGTIEYKEKAPAVTIPTTLAEYSATNYPESEEWTITNESAADAAAFDSLKLAITAANGEGIYPHIIFTQLASVPASAFASYTSTFSVELTVATSIGDSSFAGVSGTLSGVTSIYAPEVETAGTLSLSYSNLTKLELPKLSVIYNNWLRNCASLTYLDLGTDGDGIANMNYNNSSNNMFNQFPNNNNTTTNPGDDDTFGTCTYVNRTNGVTLKIKFSDDLIASNNVSIKGNYLYFTYSSNYRFEFASINEGVDDGDDDSGSSDAPTTLSEFSATNYPSGSTWYISNSSTPSSDGSDFENLELAIAAANNEEIYPCVEFTNLNTLAYAFQNFTGTFSVSLPSATALGQSAFGGATGLTAISAPNVTTLSYGAFLGATGLTTLSLPSLTTSAGAGLASKTVTSIEIGTSATSGVVKFTAQIFGENNTTTDVDLSSTTDLKIKIDDSGTLAVDGNKLTWTTANTDGGNVYSATFKSITVVGDSIEMTLSDFDGTTIPSGDTWTITDSSADADNFDNLELTIAAANIAGTTPHIIFSMLESVPASAFYSCTASFSIELSAATSIGNLAFSVATGIKSITAKKATTIGKNFIKSIVSTSALETLELGTEAADGITSFDSCQNCTPSSVALKIKISSTISSTVYASGNDLYLNGGSSTTASPDYSLMTFGSISVTE